jgi:hypothetical protein
MVVFMVLMIPLPWQIDQRARPGSRAWAHEGLGRTRPDEPRRATRDNTTDRAELHGSARSGADTVAARLTLVTLDCTPVDMETSVSETDAAVYSPTVLRLRGQPRLALEPMGGRQHERPRDRRHPRPPARCRGLLSERPRLRPGA